MSNKKELELIIEDFKKREIYSNCANPENFFNLEDSQRCAYLGIDCTANSLHIGHLLPIMQATRLAKNNFKILLLLGGATSKIGDPSDKLKERPILDPKILLENQKRMEKQLNLIFNRNENKKISLKNLPLYSFFQENEKILNSIYEILELESKIEEKNNENIWKKYLLNIWPDEIKEDSFKIVDNREWLDKLTFVDFIDKCGRNITINYLLAKETIKQRVNSENGLSFSAFSYSLLQAYDFFYLYKNYKCHGQLGASDQWGNFTTGLKMIKSFDNENKCFALSFNLILDDNGKKISKSDVGTSIIWLDKEKTSFKDLFNFFSNMSDKKAIDFVKKFTFISEEKLEKLLEINNPKSLRILQRILMELFFFLIHGEDGLNWIKENSKKVKFLTN
ncbi:MAG: Tyrosine--tRNA ligase [Mycoplasmataceae bacterium]|nr:MAG: Tyrosine--tRNA ligase [Mycoplasmataceae bacterium]